MIVHEIDDGTFDIVAMFVNEMQSPELRSALECADAAAQGMLKYLRPLPRLTAKGDVIREGIHKVRNHLSEGDLVMEGMIWGICAASKGAR